MFDTYYRQGPAQQTVGNVLSRWGASDLTTAEVENAFNQVEWTQEQVDSFSRAVINGNAYTFCLARNGVRHSMSLCLCGSQSQ